MQCNTFPATNNLSVKIAVQCGSRCLPKYSEKRQAGFWTNKPSVGGATECDATEIENNQMTTSCCSLQMDKKFFLYSAIYYI